MKNIQFEWDPSKNKSNYLKHKVSFEEAQSVFYDENAIQYFDEDHSDDEDRFIMVGTSYQLRTLLVCHCERESGLIIRIISARKATTNEIKQYGGEI